MSVVPLDSNSLLRRSVYTRQPFLQVALIVRTGAFPHLQALHLRHPVPLSHGTKSVAPWPDPALYIFTTPALH